MLLQVILSNQHGCSLLSSRKGVLRFVQLQNASCAPQVTPEEMQDIVQALVSDNAGLAGRGYTGQGHFYKCPNGHPYIIGDCGGATQVSTCPECGACIGGSQHQLTTGNTQAVELHQLASQVAP